MGELIVFDPALGQHEADGVVQRIPGYGQKVEPIIKDQLVNDSWPRFLHPYPLSEKYILTACQLNAESPWGIYLVDVFDNIVPICVEPGVALLEPVPLRQTPRPPIIPDKVDTHRKDAVVYLTDVYMGGGLAGVPRGTVKQLRLFAFDYGYQGLANHTYIGIEGPWDVHRILGTVQVEPDGSSAFRVPANTPIAVQPLDAEGKALQLMRSWFVAMPGEIISCVGCHERTTDAPPTQQTLAVQQIAADDPAVVRSGTGLQLRPRGPTDAGPVLRRLPQRRPVRRADSCAICGRMIRRVQPRLSGTAEVRPAARPRERLPHVPACRVPRRYQPADSDAGQRPLRRQTAARSDANGSPLGST